jgi:DNA-binding NarL/FixJ family response regulator
MTDDISYRLVLADDRTMFRRNLKSMLKEEHDLEVVGEAGDGLELLNLLGLLGFAPHMAIIDVSMPNLGGIEATSKIRRTYPAMKVLILSVHREKAYVHGALSAGADGYVTKQDADIDFFGYRQNEANRSLCLAQPGPRGQIGYIVLTISKWRFLGIVRGLGTV